MAYERQGFFQKRGSSNLSVNRTWEQACLFLYQTKYKHVWEFVLENNQVTLIFAIMLFKVLRRVCLLPLNIGQWRKCEVNSILEPQLEKGFKQFWKLH